MNKGLFVKSRRVCFSFAAIAFIAIVVVTGFSYQEQDALMLIVLDKIYLLSFMLILSSALLTIFLLIILLINYSDGSNIHKEIVQRVKNILATALFILFISSLLYFSIHPTLHSYQSISKIVYWIECFIVSMLAGGLVALCYLLVMPIKKN